MSEHILPGDAGVDPSRRDFIRRSAIIGGMVWAAPVIQSMGSPAFAFTPNGEEVPGTKDISYIGFLLDNETVAYKYDGDCQSVTPNFDSAPEGCQTRANTEGVADAWADADPGTGAELVEVNCDDPEEWCITPAEGYSVRWVLVKSGDGSGDDGSQCTFIEGSGIKGDPVCVRAAN